MQDGRDCVHAWYREDHKRVEAWHVLDARLHVQERATKLELPALGEVEDARVFARMQNCWATVLGRHHHMRLVIVRRNAVALAVLGG